MCTIIVNFPCFLLPGTLWGYDYTYKINVREFSMKYLNVAITVLAISAQTAMAAGSVERKLFTLEKSLNSENILNIHAFTDSDCKFVSGPNGFVDFYWLMDKQNKKEVHPMIRSKVQERVKFLGLNGPKDSFKVRLNDLSEIKHDLEDNNIEVKAEIIAGVCTVKSVIKLGASAKYKKMNLERTYCDVDKNFLGVPSGCTYLELQGKQVDTNEALKARFKGK